MSKKTQTTAATAESDKSAKTSSARRIVTGKLDLTEALEDVKPRKAHEMRAPTQKEYPILKGLAEGELRISRGVYTFLSVAFCLIFIGVLILSVGSLPSYGSTDAPTVNDTAGHYVEHGREETGATNLVAGMILDYRAFDTLGESFVLFAATVAVIILMDSGDAFRKKAGDRNEIVRYHNDPIVRIAAKFLIPIILMFGVYILFFGHLSPGGGFSGGTIIGAGLILFAMVNGTTHARSILRPGRIKAVTIVSLSFYCISKAYSFFTGNTINNLHSFIETGNPGDILSAGLILPLNLSVGLVVACTMYSLYALFHRGKI
ncbi:MAG: hypothetical protein J6B77_08215 [Clostridia bacterium]|nr:hypothetical protein [Clostridia bacterium]